MIAAIRADQPIPDPKLRALHDFARELVRTAGKPSAAAAERSCAAVKTLSNYSNHAFATKVDDAFAAYKTA